MFRLALSDAYELRPLEEFDADELYAVVDANREHLACEEGRGTMTLAVTALLDWAFGAWKLDRVEISAAVENRRSRALAARLGFREEGTRRRAERVGDRDRDHVVYSTLAGDWAARTSQGSGHDDGSPLKTTGS